MAVTFFKKGLCEKEETFRGPKNDNILGILETSSEQPKTGGGGAKPPPKDEKQSMLEMLLLLFVAVVF